MNTTLAKKNVITSILYQLVTVAYGLVVPRLVLSSFGSEVNGLVSSLRTLVTAISSSLAPSLGNSLAKMTNREANELFDRYEFGLSVITTFAFTCGALLVCGKQRQAPDNRSFEDSPAVLEKQTPGLAPSSRTISGSECRSILPPLRL